LEETTDDIFKKVIAFEPKLKMFKRDVENEGLKHFFNLKVTEEIADERTIFQHIRRDH
jgi:hypothetical protein